MALKIVQLLAYILASAYSLLLLAGLVIVIRIHYFVKPWTTAKVLVTLVAACAAVRVVFFALVNEWVDATKNFVGANMSTVGYLLDGADMRWPYFVINGLPGLVFFSTNTILVMFWARIYYTSIDRAGRFWHCLRPNFMAFNAIVYLLHTLIWALYATVPLYSAGTESDQMRKAITVASSALMSLWFVLIAVATCSYGIKTRAALNRVPVEMQILKNKLGEVRLLALVTTSCFVLRALFILYGQVEPMLQLGPQVTHFEPL